MELDARDRSQRCPVESRATRLVFCIKPHFISWCGKETELEAEFQLCTVLGQQSPGEPVLRRLEHRAQVHAADVRVRGLRPRRRPHEPEGHDGRGRVRDQELEGVLEDQPLRARGGAGGLRVRGRQAGGPHELQQRVALDAEDAGHVLRRHAIGVHQLELCLHLVGLNLHGLSAGAAVRKVGRLLRSGARRERRQVAALRGDPMLCAPT
mmetsp:Transcript_113854/g.332657  ORF Transcript_113854/g.332657 Transcript_113854/m.332657 type:complete len:209 (-) Transcript_113854:1149-1775(-)